MSETQSKAREDLQAWHDLQPSNVYVENHQLQRLLKRYLGPEALETATAHLSTFGAVVMCKLDGAATVRGATA